MLDKLPIKLILFITKLSKHEKSSHLVNKHLDTI